MTDVTQTEIFEALFQILDMECIGKDGVWSLTDEDAHLTARINRDGTSLQVTVAGADADGLLEAPYIDTEADIYAFLRLYNLELMMQDVDPQLMQMLVDQARIRAIQNKTPVYTGPTASNPDSWLATIWDALAGYREDCIPEGDESYDAQWNNITTAMAWIAEEINTGEKS